MANNTTRNPVVIDTVGVIFDTPRKVKSIVINASGDAWSVILKDASAGVINFQATQPLVNDRHKVWTPSSPVEFRAIHATTLTNITNVLIYTE